jgi:hypothetical protein
LRDVQCHLAAGEGVAVVPAHLVTPPAGHGGGVFAELSHVAARIRCRKGRLGGRHGAQTLVAATAQARIPSGSMVTSILAGSIASIRHPSAKAAMISDRVTR